MAALISDVNAAKDAKNTRIIVMNDKLNDGKPVLDAFRALASIGCKLSNSVQMLDLHVNCTTPLYVILLHLGIANFPSLVGVKITSGLVPTDLSGLADFVCQHPTVRALDVSGNLLFKTHERNEDTETDIVCSFIRSLNCHSNVEELGMIGCNTAVTIIDSIRKSCANKDHVRDRWRIKKYYLESCHINEMPKIVGDQAAKVHRPSPDDELGDDSF